MAAAWARVAVPWGSRPLAVPERTPAPVAQRIASAAPELPLPASA